MSIIRSTLFEIFYLAWTILYAVLFLWALLLPEKQFRPMMMVFYRGVTVLEKLILNLDYKLEGLENIPQDSRYIIASKHESTYETFKIPLLFDQVAIVLKKELLQIPIWGWYAGRMGAVPLDRGKARAAVKALEKAIRQFKDSDKNILIFPQGTRVPADASAKDFPYKSGIYKFYNETGLPVLPIALNSGCFWPKNSFLKKSGTITMRVLPVIEPGLSQAEFMKTLEESIEPVSDALRLEAEQQLS